MVKVLVAEDDELVSRLLVFKLKQAGFAVVAAADGETALSLAKSERPELILLDGMMPIVDGFEVLRRLKASAELKDIPVIMLTSKNKETDILTGLELGAADYIVKPFRPGELLARLRKHIRKTTGSSPKEGQGA